MIETIILLTKKYDNWDLSEPNVVRHSRLYHLEPIGIGTPSVESLTGYIARLAEAHCVSVGNLYWKEIKQITGTGNIFTGRLHKHAGYSIQAVNGIGGVAKTFVDALQKLTLHNELSHLTMLAWSDIIPKRGLLRRNQSWCSECYQEWLEEGRPIYYPLQWALQVVTICLEHQQKLSSTCPACSRYIPHLSSRSRPGHCAWCDQWLGSCGGNRSISAEMISEEEMKWQTWVLKSIGQLLSFGPLLNTVISRDQLRQQVTLCVEQVTNGCASEFARRIGVPRGYVSGWILGKRIPEIVNLLRICHFVGVFPWDFLADKFTIGKKQEAGDHFTGKPPSLNPKYTWRKIDAERVRKTLEEALNEFPPPSVNSLAERTGHNHVSLYRYFPELCYALAKNFSEFRKQRRDERSQLSQQEIKRAVSDLCAKGIKPSYRKVQSYLTYPSYLSLKEGRDLWRKLQFAEKNSLTDKIRPN